MLVNNTNSNVAAGSTDAPLVSAVAGRRVRVLAVTMSPAATPSAITFNSKPAGAGAAISATFTPSSSGLVLPYNPIGWFDANTGEGLTCTTGAGSTTGIQITYGLTTPAGPTTG